jgi:hypothetical protein
MSKLLRPGEVRLVRLSSNQPTPSEPRSGQKTDAGLSLAVGVARQLLTAFFRRGWTSLPFLPGQALGRLLKRALPGERTIY